ncbi:MAG: fumarylacetoacetate hydrolase family protein [Acidobacteria bacterium]|nr:fumarylacetoacetate hydrolase family protein [Acidobacteriota bacterium]
MRLVTFLDAAASSRHPRLGVLFPDGEDLLDVFQAIGVSGDDAENICMRPETFTVDGAFISGAKEMYRRMVSATEPTGILKAAVRSLDSVRLAAPVPRPGKIICIGLNYRDHAAESDMKLPERPLIFSKFPTCVIGNGETIELPAGNEEADYEAELAVIIGKRGRNIEKERAMEHVLGYANFNDVSERGFQFADGQWQRGKSCDTFAPIGPYLVTADEIPDPGQLSIKLRLNGETLQDSNTDQLIFDVSTLISYISETVTLEPGDVIATGTPAGVGFARNPPIYLNDGDVVEVEIQGLGVLSNPVRGQTPV